MDREEELTDGASSCHIIIDENVTLIGKVSVYSTYIWFSVFNVFSNNQCYH